MYVMQLDFADWCPVPVFLQLQTGREVTSMPKDAVFKHLKGCVGKVMEHLKEHTRIVTVRLDILQKVHWADEPVEDFKVLYSTLKFTDEETISMQDTISAFLFDTLGAGAGTAVTLIGYNEFCCESEREYWSPLGNTISLPIKAGELSVNVVRRAAWICVSCTFNTKR